MPVGVGVEIIYSADRRWVYRVIAVAWVFFFFFVEFVFGSRFLIPLAFCSRTNSICFLRKDEMRFFLRYDLRYEFLT